MQALGDLGYGLRVRKGLAVVVALALGLGGGAAALVGSRGNAARPPLSAAQSAPVTLGRAPLGFPTCLGPSFARPGNTVSLVLALHPRHAQALQHLLATGEGGLTTDYAKTYGPDPALVRPALAALRRAGLRTSWTPGQGTASGAGKVSSVDHLFHVRLSLYETPGSLRFFAANRNPVLPSALRGVVDGVAGLDNFERLSEGDAPVNGVLPGNVMTFYDIAPLRAAGLDGSGETVVFPELNSPVDIRQLRNDVASFSSATGLPPVDLTVRSDPAWHPTPGGSTDPGLVEAALDVEIVHSIAPGAKLIIYEESASDAFVGAEAAMVSENPTAIISDSIGQCEQGIQSLSVLKVIEQPWIQQATQNMTHYVAAGDDGAYGCSQKYPASVDFPADLPIVTSVGGTSVLMSPSGSYYREFAWGNALSQAGGGGGVSKVFRRPPYQTGVAGFPSVSGAPGRLVPDVSGLADPNTGWDIVTGGKPEEIGGTSAAAPLWAGITALIDEDMHRSGLRPVGFANPALYWIAAHQAQYHAFHDVTAGNNLLYVATPGWDEATGWGTPDAARLDLAWKAYERQGGK